MNIVKIYLIKEWYEFIVKLGKISEEKIYKFMWILSLVSMNTFSIAFIFKNKIWIISFLLTALFGCIFAMITIMHDKKIIFWIKDTKNVVNLSKYQKKLQDSMIMWESKKLKNKVKIKNFILKIFLFKNKNKKFKKILL